MKKLKWWNYVGIVITLWYTLSAALFTDVNLGSNSFASFMSKAPDWFDKAFEAFITFGLGGDEGWAAALAWIAVAIGIFAVCEAFLRSNCSLLHRILNGVIPGAAVIIAVISIIKSSLIVHPLVLVGIFIIWCATDVVMTVREK